MSYRLAKALEVLRDQINAAYPNRSKASDGWIGDTSHSSRASDHNPNSAGVVCAIDVTHDPLHGFDSYLFADHLRSLKDPRINYIISNGRITSSTVSPWIWRKYYGTNPHNKHVHISVKQDAKYYDAIAPWNMGATNQPDPQAPPVVSLPVLRKGAKGEDVRKLQGFLKIAVDGDFGPKTEAAVKAFQKLYKELKADGVVGQYTWSKLLTPAALSKVAQGVKYYEDAGLLKHQAVAIIAHSMWESGGNGKWTIVNDAKGDKDSHGEPTAFGMLQWRASRFEELMQLAETDHTVWEDYVTQMKFVIQEFKTTERYTFDRLKEATNVEEAVKAMVHYLRPSGYNKEHPELSHGFANRLEIAQKLYKEAP